MSRVANAPIPVPKGVEVKIAGQTVSVKGSKGNLARELHPAVEAVQEDGVVRIRARGSGGNAVAQAGTARALINNMVIGVSEGFERKLELVGVGYRAQMKGKGLTLTLGHSHPIEFDPPEGIAIETPSQTEVVVRGADKQSVGQVAAVIRGFRAPEPYKGKGVKYAGEVIVRKEAKKK